MVEFHHSGKASENQTEKTKTLTVISVHATHMQKTHNLNGNVCMDRM